MSNFAIGLIIVLVLGIIVSNLLLLKYSAKTKFSKHEPDNTPASDKDNQTQ